jgi:hypothetical protein
MLKPIISHQKEINDIYEKMKFLRAYFKKERGLFIQQLRSVLEEKELQEIEDNLQKLI